MISWWHTPSCKRLSRIFSGERNSQSEINEGDSTESHWRFGRYLWEISMPRFSRNIFKRICKSTKLFYTGFYYEKSWKKVTAHHSLFLLQIVAVKAINTRIHGDTSKIDYCNIIREDFKIDIPMMDSWTVFLYWLENTGTILSTRLPEDDYSGIFNFLKSRRDNTTDGRSALVNYPNYDQCCANHS